MYKLVFAKRAEENLEKIPEPWRTRIGKKVETLRIDPFQGKKLEGNFEGLHVVRAWPYRIVYKIHKREIEVFILRIAHRKDIYR